MADSEFTNGRQNSLSLAEEIPDNLEKSSNDVHEASVDSIFYNTSLKAGLLNGMN